MEQEYKRYWFSGSFFPVGIVKTPSGNVYIGAAQGIDEEQDVKFIANFGTKVDLFDVIKMLEISKPENEK